MKEGVRMPKSRKHRQKGQQLLTKVLLSKLSRLTHHLNNLRSIWDGQRAAFTEEEVRPADLLLCEFAAGYHP